MPRPRKFSDEERKKRKADYQRKVRWDHNHWEDRLWRGAKGSARTRGILFNITREDIKIPEVCPILGIPLYTGAHPEYYPKHSNTASLDRIDSSLGYVSGNVWVISWMANKMKQDATRHMLRLFCLGVLQMMEDGKL